MAKGTIAKEAIVNKIMEVFEGAFMDDKVIRIPWNEEGTDVEIKVALTCAKDCIAGGGSAVSKPATSGGSQLSAFDNPEPQTPIAATEEEKANVKKLVEMLGL